MTKSEAIDNLSLIRRAIEETTYNAEDLAAIYEAHWLLHVSLKAKAFQSKMAQADRMHAAETCQMMALESFEE